ncbi:MAG TPA: DNA ligase [Acholeplasmataceae bacterium]|nr:DNA ligase [Acholeplasmataceae bacterium]
MDDFNIDLSPMLFYESKPFNSQKHIFELKFDGIRALAYLDKETLLKNKRHKIINNTYPELLQIHKQVKKRCILDGEIVLFHKSKPDFFKIQKRSLMENPLKIKLQSKRYPVTFIAFDIIYYDDKFITDLPLIERKEILKKNIIENKFITISRFVENEGIKLFNEVKKMGLEGVVAKDKLSKYFLGVRSKSWLKFKVYEEDDLVICGYLEKENNTLDLILGRIENNQLIKAATVNTSKDKKLIKEFASLNPSKPLFDEVNEGIVWLKPYLVGKVKYMMKTKTGGLRQAIFLGVRDDKTINDLKK